MRVLHGFSLAGVLAGLLYMGYLFQESMVTRQVEFYLAHEEMADRIRSFSHTVGILRFAGSSTQFSTEYTNADAMKAWLDGGVCKVVSSPDNTDSREFSFENEFIVFTAPEDCEQQRYLDRFGSPVNAAPFMTFLTRNQKEVLRGYIVTLNGVLIAAPRKQLPNLPYDELLRETSLRPWFQLMNTHEQRLTMGQVLMTGPYIDFTLNSQVITLTTGLTNKGRLTGVVNIDLRASELLDNLPGRGRETAARLFRSEELDGLEGNHLRMKLSDSAWLVATDSWPSRVRFFWRQKSIEVFFTLLACIAYLVLLYGHQLNRRNSELQNRSSKDSLTGLMNRHGLAEMMKSPRWGNWVSVVMLDLDNFKRVNDTWGHPAGDEVLRVFAQCLRDCIRSDDIAVRMGGEEFMLLLNCKGEQDHRAIVERVRRSMENTVIRFGTSDLTVTVSGGCLTVARSEVGERLEPLISEADKRLYIAKHEGKNRMICERPVEEATPLVQEAC